MRRATAKTRKISHCRRRPKRRKGRWSYKATLLAQPRNSSGSSKIPHTRTEIPKTSAKTAELRKKNRHLGNTAQGNDKNLHSNRQRKRHQKTQDQIPHMPKKTIKAPHDRQIVRLGNKGGFAAPCDTDEAIMRKNRRHARRTASNVLGTRDTRVIKPKYSNP